MITIGNIKESYNIDTYYDREDIYMIIIELSNCSLINIPDETKLVAKFDDVIDNWENLNE